MQCPPLSCAVLVALVLATAPVANAQVFPEIPLEGGRGSAGLDSDTGSTTAPPTVSIHSGSDPELLQEHSRQQQPPQTSVPMEQPLNPDEYICGRGDTFELNFWGQQNFKIRALVDPEGRTFINKVGYVEVAGKTLSDARRLMKRAVARFYPGLNFDLALVAPRSFLVHIIGYFSQPGLLAATPVERVGSLLRRAGTINGSERRITIKRRNGDTLYADLLLYDHTGDTKYNPYVMDGDLISIPFPLTSVKISGPVKRPGRYELIASQDMSELLQLADGFTSELARNMPLRIIRRNKQQRDAEIQVPLSSGAAVPQFPLVDGDQIYVPSTNELQRSILLIGPVEGAARADEVTATRRIPYFEGATVLSVIERAGGLGASADLQAAYLHHEDGSTTPIDLRALLVLRDFSADKAVKVADTIVVPQRRVGVYVQGAVMRPGLYPFNPNFSPSAYVGIAGGANRNARSPDTYRLISQTGAARPARSNAKVDSGDTLVIPERTFSPAEVTQLVMGGVGLLLTAVSVAVLVTRY